MRHLCATDRCSERSVLIRVYLATMRSVGMESKFTCPDLFERALLALSTLPKPFRHWHVKYDSVILEIAHQYVANVLRHWFDNSIDMNHRVKYQCIRVSVHRMNNSKLRKLSAFEQFSVFAINRNTLRT